MLYSMTGFGEAQLEETNLSMVVEVRSLNNRFLKTTIRLPDILAPVEPEVERIIRDELSRGAVHFTIHMRQTAEAATYEVNYAAVDAYIAALERVRRLHGGEQDSLKIDMAALLSLPGVCQPRTLSEKEILHLGDRVKQLAHQALANLREMRRQEGQRLFTDLDQQCQTIRDHLASLAELADQVRKNYYERLRNRVNDLLADTKAELDETTLQREVAIFAERCDINEEVLRLRSHLEQFQHVCQDEDQAGRRLDFLTQEMLREANTIASKANDAVISQHVVEIKVAIDRLKEQIQNIE